MSSVKRFVTNLVSGLREYGHVAAGTLRHAWHEAALVVEGALHTEALSPAAHRRLDRDLAELGTETALSLADVQPEISAVIAAIEEEAKLSDPAEREKATAESVLADMFVSVVSSPAAAVKAGVSVLHDLEQAGRTWENRPASVSPS